MIRTVFQTGITFLVVLCSVSGFAQTKQDTASWNTDELFKVGRELIFDDRTEEGRKWLMLALEKSPTYGDIKVFLARTYAWDGERKKAITLLNEVLENDPKHTDCLLALCDIYYWDDNYDKSLATAERGQGYYPSNPDFRYKKARILKARGKLTEASAIIQSILAIRPGHKDALSMASALDTTFKKNSFALGGTVDRFSDRVFSPGTDTILYSYVQIGRVTPLGALQARVNWTTRNNSTGHQYEIDFYPSIIKGVYAFLNYGFSNRDWFPDHRLGAEFYISLPRSFECSIGARHLVFGPKLAFDSTSVTIYTATLAKYVGNFWLSARTNITPSVKANTFSRSLQLRGRYYLGDAGQTYIGLWTSIGFSPNESQITSQVDQFQLTPNEVYFLKAQRAVIEFQKTWPRSSFLKFSKSHWISFTGGINNQELSYSPGEYTKIWEARLSTGFNF